MTSTGLTPENYVVRKGVKFDILLFYEAYL